jgi:hypothetical protein
MKRNIVTIIAVFVIITLFSTSALWALEGNFSFTTNNKNSFASVAAGEVIFDAPIIVSTLPENVIVHENFSVTTAVAGELLVSLEKLEGTWQWFLGPVFVNNISPGQTMGMIYTDPGDITESGTYRFTLKYVPDGGGAEEVHKSQYSFVIVDPAVSIPYFIDEETLYIPEISGMVLGGAKLKLFEFSGVWYLEVLCVGCSP